MASEPSRDTGEHADLPDPSLSPDEIPRIAYRGEAAVALDGAGAWDIDRVITNEEGRWNRRGQPTLYFATDPGVALAELGRHAPKEGSPHTACLWTLRLSLGVVADARGVPDELVLDPERARAVADDLRNRGLPGLLVPSVAFLDDRDRFNLVIFAENLGPRLSGVVEAPRLIAAITPS